MAFILFKRPVENFRAFSATVPIDTPGSKVLALFVVKSYLGMKFWQF
jgi:hypothetical protein